MPLFLLKKPRAPVDIIFRKNRKERNGEKLSKPIYDKNKLLEALEAVRIATVKGIFSESERRKVVEDLGSYKLSNEVRSMCVQRKGILHECGELREILDFFDSV